MAITRRRAGETLLGSALKRVYCHCAIRRRERILAAEIGLTARLSGARDGPAILTICRAAAVTGRGRRENGREVRSTRCRLTGEVRGAHLGGGLMPIS